jgi:hypothetical protein
MFYVYARTPAGNFEFFNEAPTLEDDDRKPGAMRMAHWLRDDIPEMEHLDSDTQAVVCGPDDDVVYIATAENGFDRIDA